MPFIDALVKTPVDFCSDEITAAPPAQLFEGGSHDLLRFAARVCLRVVEKVYSGIIRRGHDLDRGVYVHLIFERNPRTQRKLTDPDSCPSQMTIFHAASSIGI